MGLTQLIYRPKNTFSLMRVLSETLGSGYVGIALETYASYSYENNIDTNC